MKIIAQVVIVECECGETMFDPDRGESMDITSDTMRLECYCGRKVNWAKRAPKTARLFV